MHSKALNFRVPRLGKNKFGVYYLRLTVTSADGKHKVVQKSLLTKDPLTAKVVALRFNFLLMTNDPMTNSGNFQYFVEAASGRIQSIDDADAIRRREAQTRGMQVRAMLHPKLLAQMALNNQNTAGLTKDADLEIDLVAGRFYARDEAAHRRLMDALDDIELMSRSFVPSEPLPIDPNTAVQSTSLRSRQELELERNSALFEATSGTFAGVVATKPPVIQPLELPPKLLREAFNEHLEDERAVGITAQTIQEKQNVFDDFLATLGEDCAFHDVSRKVINRRWKNAELKRPSRKDPSKVLSRGRLVKRHSYLTKFFDWAIDQDYLPEGSKPVGNAPFSKKQAEETKQSYKPFTKNELSMLFNENFKSFGTKPDWYWIPLIALYSGARISEVAGLELDGFEIRDDVKLFSIKFGKTMQSRRVVPIHSALMELGLWDYVQYLRKNNAKRLFPYRPKGKNAAKSIGRMWGNWVTECGIKDDSKVFHSFRSTVITELHNQIEPVNAVAVRDAVGHTNAAIAGSHGGYIMGHRLEVLRFTVEKITHPSIDLSKFKLEDPVFREFYAKAGTFEPVSEAVSPVQVSRMKHLTAKAKREERNKKSRNRRKADGDMPAA